MTRPDFAPTQVDFVHRDDMPASDVGHGPLADYVRGLPEPADTERTDEDPRGIGLIRGLLWSVAITFGAIAAGALLSAVLQGAR